MPQLERRPAPSPSEPVSTVTAEEAIRHRAYELYLQRGQEPGHEIEDWLRAEAEVRERLRRETQRSRRV